MDAFTLEEPRTVNQTIDAPMVREELRNIVSMLCTRFPERSTTDIEYLVTEVYQTLSGEARITAHLIPLTLNRCRRLLNEQRLTQPDHRELDRASAVGV